MREHSAEIVVVREPTEWRDRIRSYKLIVDGEVRASVRQGEAGRVDVGPGRHRVWMRLDWGRSHVVEVDIQDGYRAVLHSRANNRDPAILLLTFLRTRYIELSLQGIEPINGHSVGAVSLAAPVERKTPTGSILRLGVHFGALLVATIAGLAAHSVPVFAGVIALGVVVSLVLRMTQLWR